MFPSKIPTSVKEDFRNCNFMDFVEHRSTATRNWPHLREKGSSAFWEPRVLCFFQAALLSTPAMLQIDNQVGDARRGRWAWMIGDRSEPELCFWQRRLWRVPRQITRLRQRQSSSYSRARCILFFSFSFGLVDAGRLQSLYAGVHKQGGSRTKMRSCWIFKKILTNSVNFVGACWTFGVYLNCIKVSCSKPWQHLNQCWKLLEEAFSDAQIHVDRLRKMEVWISWSATRNYAEKDKHATPKYLKPGWLELKAWNPVQRMWKNLKWNFRSHCIGRKNGHAMNLQPF